MTQPATNMMNVAEYHGDVPQAAAVLKGATGFSTA